jgi:hypothetical protein
MCPNHLSLYDTDDDLGKELIVHAHIKCEFVILTVKTS